MSPFQIHINQVESGYSAANWSIVNQYNGQTFKSYNWVNSLEEAVLQARKFSQVLYAQWQLKTNTKKKSNKKKFPKILLVDIENDKDTIYNCESIWDSNKPIVKLNNVFNHNGLEK